ncbi:MAG: inositol monophosphatase family protein [Bacteriovoracia bacterium]
MKNLSKQLKKALPVVMEATRKASPILIRKFGRVKKLSMKQNAGLVTEADHESERIILRILQKKFPHDHFIAEETGAHSGQNDFCWHIDPLDGTTNFVHGFPFFCISIGLTHNDKPVLGVIHHPTTNNTYWAYYGGGAYKNKDRIRVSKIGKLNEALLTTGFSYRHREHLRDEMGSIARVIHGARGIRRTGSAALDLAFVSAGHFDGFWERGLSSWDLCAGLAILLEAGGTYSTLKGKPYNFSKVDVLATNGLIHTQLIDILNR